MLLTEHPALVVVDMQNGGIDDQGFFAKIGLDPSGGVAAIEPCARLLAAARQAGIPVIYTRYSLEPDFSDAGLLLELYPAIREAGGMVRGSWDADIIEALAPREDELIVDKTRHSAFFATDLEEQLRRRGVDQLIICGVTTNCCVEHTARDGFARDFRIAMVSDATAAANVELHEGTLATVRYALGEVVTADEVAVALAGRPRASAPVAVAE